MRVELDKPKRDALRADLVAEMRGINRLPEFRDPERHHWEETREGMVVGELIASALDQIGWEREANGCVFSLEPSPELLDWYLPKAEEWLRDGSDDDDLRAAVGILRRVAENRTADEHTITIDRATRDGLVFAVLDTTEDRDTLQYQFHQRDSSACHKEIRLLTAFVQALDSLGWEEHGDQESYVLPLDEALCERLTELHTHYSDAGTVWSEEFEPKRVAMVAAMMTVLELSERKEVVA